MIRKSIQILNFNGIHVVDLRRHLILVNIVAVVVPDRLIPKSVRFEVYAAIVILIANNFFFNKHYQQHSPYTYNSHLKWLSKCRQFADYRFWYVCDERRSRPSGWHKKSSQWTTMIKWFFTQTKESIRTTDAAVVPCGVFR